MKSSIIVLLCVVAVVLLLGGGACSSYNNMVKLEEGVSQSWGEVETQYQRRADLIPNLVSTVKGYATHEAQTFEKVTEARAKATSITLDVTDLTEENLAKYQQAQNDLSGALKSLLAVSENYPDLKASENFKDLQAQLEGTENRIATARKRYTETVQQYNIAVRRFPANIFAGMFGFSPKPQFAAQESAAQAPVVNF
ncbi:MAG: LemA family protein [Firmicutes bacterium]|nr:LemA family protein [Bacillota bacterium]MCM1400654.1 LemA family protein [Bacteroides sp.]MCM1476345.1 LemA family protein [Bacteroides sp.]